MAVSTRRRETHTQGVRVERYILVLSESENDNNINIHVYINNIRFSIHHYITTNKQF